MGGLEVPPATGGVPWAVAQAHPIVGSARELLLLLVVTFTWYYYLITISIVHQLRDAAEFCKGEGR